MSLPSERLISFSLPNPASVYLLLAVPYLISLVLIIPPFQIPDEGHHYLRSVSISEGRLLPSNDGQEGTGGAVDVSAVEFVNSFSYLFFNPNKKVTRDKLDQARMYDFKGPSASTWFSAATLYPPYAYAAPSAVLAAARAVGLSQLDGFRLARLANGLLVLVAASIAIALTPRGKWFLVALCLLPMFMAQASGISSDGAVFAISLVVVAMLARAAASSFLRPGTLMAMAGLVALVAAIRIPMIALALPLGVVGWCRLPMSGWGRGWTTGLAVAVAFLPPLLWTAVAVSGQVDPRLLKSGADAGAQVQYVLANLDLLPSIAWKTLAAHGAGYLFQFVGVLGWLDTPIDPLFGFSFYGFSAFVLVAVLVIDISRRTHDDTLFSVAMAGAAILSSALIFASLYVGWTPVGYPLVEGVQGRYFLPIAAVFGVAVAGQNWPPSEKRDAVAAGLIALFYTLSLPWVMWTLVNRYYIT